MGTRSEHVLEIRRGEGSPMSMRLRPGTRVEPTSFGRVAAWTIDGSGVFDVHGYVYWDGEGLFVQSADGRDPVRANGVPVGESWTPIAAPTTLSFGDVRIAFAQENERAPTTSVRPAAGGRAPARSLPPQRPTRPPAVAKADDPGARCGRG